MLNQSPIILNCLSRGGSNILWNMFLSHPEVCSPILETLEIFRTDPRDPHIEGFVIALLSGQPRLFDQWNLGERKRLSDRALAYIDRTLYRWKQKTFSDEDMRFKYEDEVYDLDEVNESRLCMKNNNGLIFANDLFQQMYPNATFFGLVRHPLALYESHLRHRTRAAKSVESFADFYTRIVGRMLEDEARLERFCIVRFEDILAHPRETTSKVFSLANLDFGMLRKIRFKAKPHLQANGRRTTEFVAGRHYWFEFGEVYVILEPNVNAYQMNRIDNYQAESLLQLTEEVRNRLGYGSA